MDKNEEHALICICGVVIALICLFAYVYFTPIISNEYNSYVVDGSSYAVNTIIYSSPNFNYCNITSVEVFTSINGIMSSKYITYGNATIQAFVEAEPYMVTCKWGTDK